MINRSSYESGQNWLVSAHYQWLYVVYDTKPHIYFHWRFFGPLMLFFKYENKTSAKRQSEKRKKFLLPTERNKKKKHDRRRRFQRHKKNYTEPRRIDGKYLKCKRLFIISNYKNFVIKMLLSLKYFYGFTRENNVFVECISRM